ncbi:hypothetical protein Gohar_024784 [Gossypium harknessii]|uniref:Secreted protein n=1 Tax=Gossypium harknessii TaxID=34285 RepID=A0A7J9HHI8_9ROSI|nr:hypothetical protein [Gossypium harknessii]
MRGEPMWKFAMVLVLLSNLGKLSFAMASKSITLFSPRVARSRMVKTTLGYRVQAMCCLEQVTPTMPMRRCRSLLL